MPAATIKDSEGNSFSIKFKTYRAEDDGEPWRFIDEFEGLVFRKTESTEHIAKVRGYVIRVLEAELEGESLLDVFDSENKTLSDYYPALFDVETDAFKDDLLEGLADSSKVLIVDRIEILPSFRGRRLGLSIMKRAIKRYAERDTLIAIHPFPLFYDKESSEWHQRIDDGSFASDRKTALSKLRRHWKQLGFERVKGSPYYVGRPVKLLGLD